MTRRSPRIAAAVIALNEERNLPGLVESLRWVDEIVVVDGGSSDATLAMARRLGCNTVLRPFDDYASQRNAAIAAARADWVFSIDADERPSARFAAELCGAIAAERYDAFRVPIRSVIFGRLFRFSGTQDDLPLRVARRCAASWSGSVHERLRAAGRVGTLRNGLEHRTIPTLSAFLSKMHRYTTLEAQARVAAGIPPRRSDRWIMPVCETVRRLVWKHGWLDGPQGWAFSILSGVSAGVTAATHLRLWREQRTDPRPR
jgi:glycosyltransferase involved in cell wall biosynthesis